MYPELLCAQGWPIWPEWRYRIPEISLFWGSALPNVFGQHMPLL